MPIHQVVQNSPYTVPQLYALVADVENYPSFIPWCKAVRVLKREGNLLEAELVIGFRHITEQYSSEVTLSPPDLLTGKAMVEARAIRGPFKKLTNLWQFVPRADGGTEIDFYLEFEFRSPLLGRLIGGLFAQASRKLADAFRKRADELYGNQ